MNKLHQVCTCVLALSMALTASAADVAKQHPRFRLSRPSGGLLLRKISGKVIAVRNAQTSIPSAALEAAADHARRTTYLPVVIIAKDEKRNDVAAEVMLTDAPVRAGQTVVVAPEQHFAELATSWLVADSPENGTRDERIKAELTRVVLMTLGCGISPFQPDLMCYVSSLKALDRLSRATIGPATRSVFEETRQRLNIEKIAFATYRQACQEGWAPAPSNDEQKAIWKEVHELPSAPITIEKK